MLSSSTTPLLILAFLTVARADDKKPDPNPAPFFPYTPSLYGNGGEGGVMSLLCLISLIYMFIGARKDKWAWVLPVGTGLMGIGAWGRVYLRHHQIFLVYRTSSLLVTCLPVSFLAFNYIVFGRFITAIQGHSDPKQVPGNADDCKYSPISPQRVKMLFVTSDLVTLFIVTTGSALQLSTFHDLTQEGANIFLFGTILQVVSYGIFTVTVIVTHFRMFKHNRRRFSMFNLKEPCVQIFFLIYVSGIGILVRSFYRLVEAVLGIHSNLSMHEIYYLVLDATPLCLAAGVWILKWPGNILQRIQEMAPAVVLDNSQCEVMQPGTVSIQMDNAFQVKDDDAVSLGTFDSDSYNDHKFKMLK